MHVPIIIALQAKSKGDKITKKKVERITRGAQNALSKKGARGNTEKARFVENPGL